MLKHRSIDEVLDGAAISVTIIDAGATDVKGNPTISLRFNVEGTSVIDYITMPNVKANDRIIQNACISKHNVEVSLFAIGGQVDITAATSTVSISLKLRVWNPQFKEYSAVGRVYYIDDITFTDARSPSSIIVPTIYGDGHTIPAPLPKHTPNMIYVGKCQEWSFYKSPTNDSYEWRNGSKIKPYTTLQTALEAFTISDHNHNGHSLEDVRKEVGVAINFHTDLDQYEHELAIREQLEAMSKHTTEYQTYLLAMLRVIISELTAASKRKVTKLLKSIRRPNRRPNI